jgi:predicted RNase H-like nuclease
VPLFDSPSACIVGIDLAWGDRNRDGLCLLRATRRRAEIVAIDLTLGDRALADWLAEKIAVDSPALLTLDAPIIIRNRTGTRPVDRLTHRMFHREHAACHPANLGKCPRPVRIGRRLQRMGYTLGWDLAAADRLAAEVYPHPAMVRLFGLDRIVKYKKGPIANKRSEFARLQGLIRRALRDHFPQLAVDPATDALLTAAWTKPIEDQTDALFCALIGYHHWLHRGARSEVIGDTETGFILLPATLTSDA